MGITRSLDYAQRGLAVDAYTYGMTGGAFSKLGLLAGLFTPDVDDMRRVYRADRTYSDYTRDLGGFKIGEFLFGKDTAKTHSGEFPTWLKLLAGAAVGTVLLPMLMRNGLLGQMPSSIYSTPFSPAQLIPLAWNRGYIRNWGLMAGLIR